jgi:branched-chain amino acid transport system substrate-binding protein
LNQQQVPSLFVGTGSSHWGTEYKQYPWTIGYQPDYVSEAKIYAKDVLRSHPNARIGVLRENDDYGLDYMTGMRQVFGSRADSMIVDVETYEVNAADVSSQVAALKNRGADLFLIAATSKYAALAIAQAAKLAWKPATYLSNVSTQIPIIRAAIAASTPDAADGIVSSVYLKDPADRARWGADSGMQLYMDIMARYCQGCDVNDVNYLYGMSIAWTFEHVLLRAGRDGVTRDNVMRITRSMGFRDNPFLLPGITIQTGGDNQFPITQEAPERWENGAWVVDRQIINAR